jgi:hypothetical protein
MERVPITLQPIDDQRNWRNFRNATRRTRFKEKKWDSNYHLPTFAPRPQLLSEGFDENETSLYWSWCLGAGYDQSRYGTTTRIFIIYKEDSPWANRNTSVHPISPSISSTGSRIELCNDDTNQLYNPASLSWESDLVGRTRKTATQVLAASYRNTGTATGCWCMWSAARVNRSSPKPMGWPDKSRNGRCA